MSLTPLFVGARASLRTFHGDGLASDSVAVATMLIYYLFTKSKSNFGNKKRSSRNPVALLHTLYLTYVSIDVCYLKHKYGSADEAQS
jgi:hypothetical protein